MINKKISGINHRLQRKTGKSAFIASAGLIRAIPLPTVYGYI
jgi:hypothetical protein